MEKINIERVLDKVVHRPRLGYGGPVLYTQLDGYKEGKQSMDNVMQSKFNIVSQTDYSSPNNIRRLFITGNQVVIQTYKPFKTGKKYEQGCWYTIKLKNEDNIYSAAMQNVKYNTDIQAYQMAVESFGTTDIKKPERIQITGNPFKILNKPWVMSNIEEVYLDWSILSTTEVTERNAELVDFLNYTASGESGKIINNSQGLMQLFFDGNVINVKSLRNRYGRLKCLAVITNLDYLLNNNYYKGKPNIDVLNEYSKCWYEYDVNVELIKQSSSNLIINRLTDGIDNSNPKFTTRSGIYKFDADTLDTFFDRVKQILLADARANRDKKLGLNSTDAQDEQQSQQEQQAQQEQKELSQDAQELIDWLTVGGDSIDINKKISLNTILLQMKASDVQSIKNSLPSEIVKKYFI